MYLSTLYTKEALPKSKSVKCQSNKSSSNTCLYVYDIILYGHFIYYMYKIQNLNLSL